ncbi:Hint domain-containing protein [Halocynthiibacter styelae]|uniref:Hint domain-containing protein n=1 Tax=Halocynthiibacter styelae TaxID=2761955 RepID=A0A8J7ICJ8_9RHOB|nr:Hint domain-containing protein [Paenihalocynthiibacter styelae]MBI1492854.1 Hint domain-containing protein [Paenihalocynthiibacter styelae]
MATNSVPPVPSGASAGSATTSDAKVDKKKAIYKIELDDHFGSVSGSNDFTITDDVAGDEISELQIKKLGKNDGEVDVVRVDLSTFDDDFDLTLNDEGSEDQLYFENIDGISGPTGGVYTITYTGSDGNTHEVEVDPGDASVFYTLADPRDGYVDGTSGNDTIGAGYTDADGDQVDGNDALLPGASGNEDYIIGYGGDDTISGGAQNDIIYGDSGPASSRDTLHWADSGLTNGSTTIGGTTVTVSSANVSTGFGTQLTSGLTGDSDTPVDANSNLSLEQGAGTAEVEFSQPVENLEFRINDFESGFEVVEVRIYDANGNLIPYTYSAGSAVATSASGSVVTFSSTGGSADDTDPDASVLITVAGPVGKIEFIKTGNSGSLAVTNLYFDGVPGDPSGTPDGDDVIRGGAGDDTVFGGGGDDTIYVEAGNDTLNGESGDDDFVIDSNTFGNDTITGGETGEDNGGDEIDAGAVTNDLTVDFSAPEAGTLTDGSQTMSFSEIEKLTTGSGDDVVTGSTGNENISTGAGDDHFEIADNFGTDSFVAGEGGETDGDTLDASAVTGSLNLNLSAPEAGTLTGSGGSASFIDVEKFILGQASDTATGSSGADHVDGGGGSDVLSLNGGNDTVVMSTGSDVIAGGTGQDIYDATGSSTASGETIHVTVNDGGNGNVSKVHDGSTDTISSVETYTAGEDSAEADSITLADVILRENIATDINGISDSAIGTLTTHGGSVISFGGAGQPTINQLLAGTYSHPTLGTIGGGGNYEITDGDEDGQIGNISFSNFETIKFEVVCFVQGTRILTDLGEVAIEDLQPGDMVKTLDNGYQPIRWIGSKTVPAEGHLAPVLIREGALDNSRDLLVSPQHRMLLRDWRLELITDSNEALVPAKHLVNDTTILRRPGGDVEYFHMLFDTHQIVFSEGAPSESFHPGETSMGSFSDAARQEIYEIFPELEANVHSYGPSARMTLKPWEMRALIT